MMVASVVLPRPGGPYSSTWSSDSPRDFAASIATERFSFTFPWPMNSCNRRGRSFNSKLASSSSTTADTTRSLLAGSGVDLLRDLGVGFATLSRWYDETYIETNYLETRD